MDINHHRSHNGTRKYSRGHCVTASCSNTKMEDIPIWRMSWLLNEHPVVRCECDLLSFSLTHFASRTSPARLGCQGHHPRSSQIRWPGSVRSLYTGLQVFSGEVMNSELHCIQTKQKNIKYQRHMSEVYLDI